METQSIAHASTFLRRAAALLLAGTIGFAASGAFAAGQCEALKAAVGHSGSYVYHFSDPAHPGLDLFERYVSSSQQCDIGTIAASTQVGALPGCELPTCVRVSGIGNH